MMKSVFRFISATACAILLTAPVAALEVQTHTSPAGQSFTFVQMPDATQTFVRFVWKGGIGFVPRGKETLSELGPAMLVNGGSVDLPPNELSTQLDAIGAGVQIYSGSDALHGILTAPGGNLSAAAALLNRVLTEPAFESRWLSRFKRMYTENVSAQVSTPAGQAWRTMRKVTMGDHPLLHAWNDTPVENIATITIDDIQDWHRRVITRGSLAVFAAGDAKLEEVAAAIDVTLRDLPERSGRQDFEHLTMRYPPKTILVHRPEAEKSYILVGGPVPKNYSEDQEAREIGVGVLGVSDQSRLFTAVRQELRAAYGFSAWINDFTRDNAIIYFQGEVDSSKLAEAYETVRDTYETFRTGGISLVEFPFAQRLYKNRAVSSAETPQGVANLMVEAWLTDRNAEHGLAYPERAASLSRCSVNNAIKRDFPPFSEMVKIVVSPDRDALAADCIINDFSEAAQCC